METLFDLTKYEQKRIGDYWIDCEDDGYSDAMERTRKLRVARVQKRQRDSINRAKLVQFLSDTWCKTGQIFKIAFAKNNTPLIVYSTPSGSKGCRFVRKAEFIDVLFNFLSAVGAMEENWQDKLAFNGDLRIDDGSGFFHDAFYFSLTNTSPIPLSTLATGGSSITQLSGFVTISDLIASWNLAVNVAAIALLPISVIRSFIAPAPRPPAPPAPPPPPPDTPRKKHKKPSTNHQQLSLF